MKKVSLSDIEAGGVVARPVVSSNGVVLVQPGTVLTPELIERLDQRGVQALWLQGSAPGAKSIEALLADLDARFAGYEKNPLMMQLKDIVASQLTRGESEP